MTREVLVDQRRQWMDKPVLRALYHDYYRRIVSACRRGLTLEVGGGSGNLKQYLNDVISTDIVTTPWLDCTVDAQALPFDADVFENIVMVDVLHHVEHPMRFLREAVRVLRPGGRLVMVEPAITPVSHVFYRHFHPEPVDMDADPFADGVRTRDRLPFDANQAIPTLLFRNRLAEFRAQLPQLELRVFQFLSLFAYPLSGGFRSWSLLPTACVAPVLHLENRIASWLGRVCAFRLFVVLECDANTVSSTSTRRD